MWKNMVQRFGIDLGTSNTLIYQYEKGIVLQEPSVVALRKDSGEIEAVGEQAQLMIGRTPHHLEIVHPLQDGVIANLDMATMMLQHFLRKIRGRSIWQRSAHIFISVPCGITNVQKRAIQQAVFYKGTKKSVVIKGPVAAALGAGLPVQEAIGSMILDIGGGTSQVAVLSLGDIVASRYVKKGGMTIDREIIDHVKKTHNLEIGERTAEEIKKTAAWAIEPEKDSWINVKGRGLVDGLPKTVVISSYEIFALLNDFFISIVDMIRFTLEQCSPELAGDVMERGILVCGGGALLRGLDQRLQFETNIPIHLADEPIACTALGTGKMLVEISSIQ